MLNALRLDVVSGGYHFAIRVSTSGSPTATQGIVLVDGTIDPFGRISVASRTPSGPPMCPICLARGTRIATPHGDVAVEDLRVGDVVWTLDAGGRRVAAPLVDIGSMPVPPTHEVVHLALDDGRSVFASPGHPTADGRHVGDLVVGDELDGAHVTSTERVPYAGGATFDVLPAGASGAYWADGVLLGSTLGE
ncbi:MAG: Hint domain-containing protein [Chloroflexota bacterium]|nr:Hint domain-containing protein [Chloroflexota bacterium]